MSQRETYLLSDSTWRRGRNALAAVALAGWAASAAAWSADPHAFFTAYLTAFVFCASILAGALFFVIAVIGARCQGFGQGSQRRGVVHRGMSGRTFS